MGLFNDLIHIGLLNAKTPSQRRSILLSNAVSIILFVLGLILFALYLAWYGRSVVTIMILIIDLISLFTLLFNFLSVSNLVRVWMCIYLPLSVMALSIYSKTLYYESQEELDYFTFRMVILSCCVLPPVFFSLKEKTLLTFSSLTILIVLLLHDPLHSYFGVP